jgi:outer membrane lipoprotein SlyB
VSFVILNGTVNEAMTNILNFSTEYAKLLTLFTLGTLVTTQCASTPDGRKAQAQATAIGAGVGAIGMGVASGSGDGALLGAAIGGVVGFAYGTHVAHRKQQFKSTEVWLDACIAQAESQHKAAVASNSKLELRLPQLQGEVQAAAASRDKAKLTYLRREIGVELAATKAQATEFGRESEMQRAAIKQAGSEGASRVNSLRQSISGIDAQVSIMAKGVEIYTALASQTNS